MSDSNNTIEHSGAKASMPGLGQLVRRSLALGLLLAVAVVCALVLVPDGNDYGQASILKQKRLSSLEGPRIVLVGGSNLAYGIDSGLIESLTGCPVANMGMNGYFGVRYMLAEVEVELRSGDVAVLAFEYDSFVKSVDGTGADLLMAVKSNPSSISHMTRAQVADVLRAIPIAARYKVDRLADKLAQILYDSLLVGPEESLARKASAAKEAPIRNVESLSGFLETGDLISHIGIQWPRDQTGGLDLTSLPVDPGLIPQLRTFSERTQGRGVDVILSYTPVMRSYFEQHRDAISKMDALFREDLAGLVQVPSKPESYVYDQGDFFDTVYHLDREGRDARSRHLALDITARNGGSESCRGN